MIIKLFRDIIYIGESGEGTVYFDTVRNIALVSLKSRLLDTNKSKILNRYIPFLIGTMLSLGAVLHFSNSFSGYYTYGTLIFLSILWAFEFFALVFLLERALYKNVKKAVPTDKTNFRIALYSNMFWNNFNDKKVTRSKKVIMWMIVVAMFLASIGCIPIFFKMLLPMVLNSQKIGNEIIMISLLGVLPFASYLLIWQNNPIRLLNIAEKYQKRELKWGIDIKDNKNSD